MENKQIFVKEFCKKYSTTTSEHVKDQMIRSIMKTTYVPVMKKRALLQVMLDKSMVTTGHGTEYIDMFLSRINLIMGIVALYTNLKVERDEDNIPITFKAYDVLIQSGVLSKIYEQIPEQELAEITSINGVLMDNFYNEHNVENFVAKQVSRFGALIGSFGGTAFDGLKEVLSQVTEMPIAENKTDFTEV